MKQMKQQLMQPWRAISVFALAAIVGLFSFIACEGTTDVAVTNVTLSKPTLTLAIGASELLTPTVLPADATNKIVTWSTTDATVATVNNGMVTGVAAGNAIITVKTDDGGKTALCSVTVSAAAVPATGVTLNAPTLSLSIGGTSTLQATVEPEEATDKTVGWSSSKPNIASVSNDGLVTALAAGEAVITVITTDGGHQDECTVTVTAEAVAVTGVSLNPNPAEVQVNGRVVLTPVFEPTNATNRNVTYTSNATEFATVDAYGYVTGVQIGAATITVTTADGGYKATSQVNVVAATGVPPQGMSLTPKNITIAIGETGAINALFTPSSVTETNVTFSYSEEGVVTTEANAASGAIVPLTITPLKVGTTTLTVTSEIGGFIDKCEITVIDERVMPTGITLSPDTKTISVGESFSLKGTFAPANTTDQTILWVSGSGNINLPYNPAGGPNPITVTGKKEGSATITALSKADGSIKATCEVTVIAAVPVTGVEVTPTSKTIGINEELQLAATVLPANASNKQVGWASNNSTVASVDFYGKVTGKAQGAATITVTTGDGNKTATSVITVTDGSVAPTPVNSVTLDKETHEMTEGENVTLLATVLPAEANQAVTWSSNSTTVATVDNTGKVTAVAAGTAKIKVISTADNSKFDECTITVNAATVAVESVGLDKTSGSLTVGKTLTLQATVLPAEANQQVNWTSSNATAATVNASGVVTALDAGATTITATSAADNTKFAECAITVTVEKLVTDLYFSGVSPNSTINTLGGTATVRVSQFIPNDATNKGELEWSTGDESVATISVNPNQANGAIITAVAPGTTTFSASVGTYTEVAAATITVNDGAPAMSLVINPKSLLLEAGSTGELTVTVYPTAAKQTVTWTSSDPNVATVNPTDGKTTTVTAVSDGSATITGTTDNGKTATATIIVAQTVVINSVSVTPSTVTTPKNKTIQLTATTNPIDGNDAALVWIAILPVGATNMDCSVDQTGLVTIKDRYQTGGKSYTIRAYADKNGDLAYTEGEPFGESVITVTE